MASHLSTIGFDASSNDDLVALIGRVASRAAVVEAEAGRYLRWSPDTGEELWLQQDPDGRIVGATPHFSGRSSVRVSLTARVSRGSDMPLDAAFHGWANPSDDAPDSGDYPFVFDCPDAAVHADLAVPGLATVQLAAFAHEVSAYESPEAYGAAQAAQEVKFASRSFIPSGLFSPGGESTEPPQAHAIFTGHVLEAAERRNALTGKAFHWAVVDTLGGAFDVVIDPSLLAVRPRPGGVLSGSFWLSGRFRSYTRRRPSGPGGNAA